MIYHWKEASTVPVPAQVAGEELERIRTFNNGRLEAEDVVEASRNPNAPLHPAFEWNDEKAAAAHRRQQASYVIRSIEITVERSSGPSSTRAFVSVVRERDRSYTSTAHALSDPELRQQVLAQALSELAAWRNRYAELVDLAKIFAVIDEARGAE